MKKEKKPNGLAGLVVVTALAFGVVFATQMMSKDTTASETAKNAGEAIDISGYQDNEGGIQVRSAAEHLAEDGSVDGYVVTVASKGFMGDIVMDVALDKSGDTISSLSILEQAETPEFGGKITEETFLSQFNNVAGPVYLPGMGAASADTAETEAAPAEALDLSNVTLKDGTYKAESEGYKAFTFNEVVTLTVSGGKITEVVWDAYNEAGEYKSVLAADGAYEMNPDGIPWNEQAIALANYVVENQGTDTLNLNAKGKIDSVSGVSVSISTFVDLVQQCLAESAGITLPTETADTVETPATTDAAGTEVEAISGATISSTAVIEGINKAQTFVKDFVLAQ